MKTGTVYRTTLLLAMFYFFLLGLNVNAQELLHPTTVEDFEESSGSGFQVYSSRGCSLKLSSEYFVISGKQSAELDVSNLNVDPSHPPGFYVRPSSSDWSSYQALVFDVVALPLDFSSGINMIVQLKSPGGGEGLRTYQFTLTPDVPTRVVVNVSDVAFRDRIATIFFGPLTSGSFFIDNVQIAKENDNRPGVALSSLSEQVRLPFQVSFGLSQDGAFTYAGTYYYNPLAPLIILLKPSVPTGGTTAISCKGANGESLLQTQVTFNSGDTLHVTQVRATGSGSLTVTVGSLTKKIAIKDISGLASLRQENDRGVARNLTSSSVFPAGRRLVVAYAGMKYNLDGVPDIKEMVSRLKDLGVNCYAYLIYPHPAQDFAALPDFCSLAQSAGIEVWAYLVPPSEAPTVSSKNNSDQKYPPFGLDYVRWAKEIANISKSHANLTLWMIDDFDRNLNLFTPSYAQQVVNAAKAINQSLLFGAVIYHEDLKTINISAYAPIIQAVLWGYQDNAQLDPVYGISASSLPIEINDYWKTFPNALVIPCIYFTPHSSWSGRKASASYLQDALSKAITDAGIVFVYTTPSPGTPNYDIVKNFCRSTLSK